MLSAREIVLLGEAAEVLGALAAEKTEAEWEQFLDGVYQVATEMQQAAKDKPFIVGIVAAAYTLHVLLEELERRRVERRGFVQ